MKILILFFLLFSVNSFSQTLIFSPKQEIRAIDMNQNFQVLKNKFAARGVNVLFDEYSKGSLITKASIINNFNIFNNLVTNPISINILEEEISSEKVNELFVSMNDTDYNFWGRSVEGDVVIPIAKINYGSR